MLRNIIITFFISLLAGTASYADNNISHSKASIHFNIPSHVSAAINNNSKDTQLQYQCKLYAFDDFSSITFQSIKGNNKINTIVLNEGYQVYLKIENNKETLLVIDRLGRLELINKGDDSIDVYCNA